MVEFQQLFECLIPALQLVHMWTLHRRDVVPHSNQESQTPVHNRIQFYCSLFTLHYITLYLLCLDGQSYVIIIGYIQQQMHTLYALEETANSMYRFTCAEVQAVKCYLGNPFLLCLEDHSNVTIQDSLGSRCLQIECISRICEQHVPIHVYESTGREMVSQ